MNALDIITEHYLRAGVWSSLLYKTEGDEPVPFDTQYEWDDCSNIDDVEAEISEFVIGNLADVIADIHVRLNIGDTLESCLASIGHDFLLSRDRHGTGFWDRGLRDVGQRLHDAAKVYGDSQFMPNDDGLTYTAEGSTR